MQKQEIDILNCEPLYERETTLWSTYHKDYTQFMRSCLHWMKPISYFNLLPLVVQVVIVFRLLHVCLIEEDALVTVYLSQI